MKYLVLSVFLLIFLDATSQRKFLFSAFQDIHQTPNVSGGNALEEGGSISYSVGQVFINVNQSHDYVVLEGVQQPNSRAKATFIEEKNNLLIKAYPNPFTHVLYVEVEDYKNKNLQYALYDIQGNLLNKIKVKEKTTEVFLYNLQAAAYLLKVFNGDQIVTTLKLIKK